MLVSFPLTYHALIAYEDRDCFFSRRSRSARGCAGQDVHARLGGGVAAFEEKYLGAYDLIFEAVGKVASLDEAGETEGGDLSMSDGMEPHRLIGVVVMNQAALRPKLLEAICRISTNSTRSTRTPSLRSSCKLM